MQCFRPQEIAHLTQQVMVSTVIECIEKQLTMLLWEHVEFTVVCKDSYCKTFELLKHKNKTFFFFCEPFQPCDR